MIREAFDATLIWGKSPRWRWRMGRENGRGGGIPATTAVRTSAQPASSAPQLPGTVEPDALTPLADGFVRDGDVPVAEEIVDVAETQAEPVVAPDGVTNDLGWKAVFVVAQSSGLHHPTLSTPST